MARTYEYYLDNTPEGVAANLREASSHLSHRRPVDWLDRPGVEAVYGLRNEPKPVGEIAQQLLTSLNIYNQWKGQRPSTREQIPVDTGRRKIVPGHLFMALVPRLYAPEPPIEITGDRSLRAHTGKRYTFPTDALGDGALALLNVLNVCGPGTPPSADLLKHDLMGYQDVGRVAARLQWVLGDLVGWGHDRKTVDQYKSGGRTGPHWELDGAFSFVDKR